VSVINNYSYQSQCKYLSSHIIAVVIIFICSFIHSFLFLNNFYFHKNAPLLLNHSSIRLFTREWRERCEQTKKYILILFMKKKVEKITTRNVWVRDHDNECRSSFPSSIVYTFSFSFCFSVDCSGISFSCFVVKQLWYLIFSSFFHNHHHHHFNSVRIIVCTLVK
jgi:hypothetical protein